LTLVISTSPPHYAMFTCQVELLNSSARPVLRVWNGVCLKEATRRTASHRHWPTDGQVETDTRPRGSHSFLRRNSEACTKIGAGLASFALPWIPAQPAQQMVAPSPTGHTCPRTATCMLGPQWGTCFFWKQQCTCREGKPLSQISNSVTDVTRNPG